MLLAAVARPSTEVFNDIPFTVEEIEVVKAVMPSQLLIQAKQGGKTLDAELGASAQALMDKLPEATILHLACHGYQDPKDPIKSGFMMQDEMLTIEKLVPLPLPRAFLAFLSACETAKGDKVCPPAPTNTTWSNT
jgi:CHAT domain-containing protein